jgi:hypothetical protein
MTESDGVGFIIRDLWTYLAIYGNDGDEGIVAWHGLPLIAADLIRLQQIRPMAEKVAKASGLSIRLVRFTTRTEIDVIESSV